MTTISIAPLRKRQPDGELYCRLPEVETRLMELSTLSREELAAQCAFHDPDAEGYVPSECLLNLVREHRSKPLDACAEALFKALLERVLAGLPKAEAFYGEKEDMSRGNMRDEAKFRFLEMLGRDRQGEYVEALDFYEVRFGRALKMLRIDAERKLRRFERPLKPLEIDETGDFTPEVEKATSTSDMLDPQKLKDLDYRSRLDAAIDDLPDIQKAIVEMIRKGIPIESKESEKMTISAVLKKTPKTIATHRDKAYAKLRTLLTKEEAV